MRNANEAVIGLGLPVASKNFRGSKRQHFVSHCSHSVRLIWASAITGAINSTILARTLPLAMMREAFS